MTPGDRDRVEVDALRTDRYLEALLLAADRRAADVPADAGLDPTVRDAATRLARDLMRIHPSFRFEERLAARLTDVAAALRLPAAAGAEGAALGGDGALAFLPVSVVRPGAGDGRPDPADELPDERDDPHGLGGLVAGVPDAFGRARPMILRGALTSAALSLAGAAYVAWRRNRTPPSPMARAVRAARQARLAPRPRRGLS